jgi:hypothetical protein
MSGRARWRRLYLVTFEADRAGRRFRAMSPSMWQAFGEFYAETEYAHTGRAEARAAAFRCAREQTTPGERFGVRVIDVPWNAFPELDSEPGDASGVLDAEGIPFAKIPHTVGAEPPKGFRRLWFLTFCIEARWQIDGEWLAADMNDAASCQTAKEAAYDQAATNQRDHGWAYFVTPIDVPRSVFR